MPPKNIATVKAIKTMNIKKKNYEAVIKFRSGDNSDINKLKKQKK